MSGNNGSRDCYDRSRTKNEYSLERVDLQIYFDFRDGESRTPGKG